MSQSQSYVLFPRLRDLHSQFTPSSFHRTLTIVSFQIILHVQFNMASRITQSPSPPDRSITSFDAEVETSSIYSEPEAEERLKKRSKTSAIEYNDSKAKKTRKTRGGKLRDLPGMPLDILFEIFGHLLPRDVLHLSRATKSLRNILMRRSAVSIWKNAFSNLRIKPPSRPSDMTEPQWASFLFDSYCQASPIP